MLTAKPNIPTNIIVLSQCNVASNRGGTAGQRDEPNWRAARQL